MAFRKALKIEEIEDIIENEWNEDRDGNVFVTALPPENVDVLTDEEFIDDSLIPMNDNENLTKEIAGTFEYTTENGFLNFDADIEFEPSTSKASKTKRRMLYKPLSAFGEPKWSHKRCRNKQFLYDNAPTDEWPMNIEQDLFNKLANKSPLELFELFFDDDVFDLIINETNKYAKQNNSDFCLETIHLRRFLGILILSGYHTLPSIDDYWSKQPSLGVEIVKQSMSRNKFKIIKSFLHFCDNNELDKNDKLAKMRPLFNIINKKFNQFGVWSENLSIDEQMVPYFGRQSCKMYIRNKPIRFGYKLWCLCSSDGYLFSCIPYAGSSDSYDRQIGLGADVVLRLLENVEQPNQHKVYFDNFFTSYYLMCLLSEKHFNATGTTRANRINNAPLKTGKQLERGEHDYVFDSRNKLLFCRWADNKEVTISSNFDQIEPMKTVKRWKKENQAYVNYNQPLLLHHYNVGMGGVDLHDNGVANYRINIRSKKWYWPLWISVLSSSVVNAWKLHCFIAKYKNEKPMPQKNFRVSICEKLLLACEDESSQESQDEYQPYNLPRVSGTHVVVSQEQGKYRRCQLKKCGKPTKFMCKKCNIHLHTKCFEKYHEK